MVACKSFILMIFMNEIDTYGFRLKKKKKLFIETSNSKILKFIN
jgi:hypothetical protein